MLISPFSKRCASVGRIKTLSLVGWAVASSLLGFTGCKPGTEPGADKGKAAAKPSEPLAAVVTPVALHQWPTIVKTQGSLIADDTTTVGARVAGLVAKTFVDVGDSVDAGTLLVSLDDKEFALQLGAAEAALLQARALVGLKPDDPLSKLDPQNAPPVREARATLDETLSRAQRWQSLRDQNAVAEEEVQTILAAAKVADARYAAALNSVNSNIAQVVVRSAEVDLAKQRLQDAHIVAPYAGFVQQRLVSPGTYVQIGTPLITIVRMATLRFRGSLPERLAPLVEVGQKVRLHIEARSEPVDVEITRINPALDMSSRSLTFEAVVDNYGGSLRPGLFAEAEVTLKPDAQAVVIASESLVEFAGAEKVWKVVDGNAREQTVRIGRRVDGLIEILEGIAPGDQILLKGSLGRVAEVIPQDATTKATAATPAASKLNSTSNDSASPSATTKAKEVATAAPASVPTATVAKSVAGAGDPPAASPVKQSPTKTEAATSKSTESSSSQPAG